MGPLANISAFILLTPVIKPCWVTFQTGYRGAAQQFPGSPGLLPLGGAQFLHF